MSGCGHGQMGVVGVDCMFCGTDSGDYHHTEQKCSCENPVTPDQWKKGHEGSCTSESNCDADCYPPPTGFCLACQKPLRSKRTVKQMEDLLYLCQLALESAECALADIGCDCGTDEPRSCANCLVAETLKKLGGDA